MRVVINVPDDWEACRGYPTLEELEEIVARDIPLPKGHGRLGDLDALAEFFRNARRRLIASDYATGIEFHTRDNMLLNAEQFTRHAATIIEADGGEQE